MLIKTLRILGSALVLLVSAAGIWSQVNTRAINELVEEANKHFQQGADLHNEARPKYNAFDEAIHSFPAHRSELERQGGELASLYGRSAEQYRLAAVKGDEAARKSVDPQVKRYFQLKSHRWNKSAEIRDLLGKYVLVVTDPAVGTHGEFMTRRAEIDAQIVILNKEEKDLEAEADRIYSDNRAKFD